MPSVREGQTCQMAGVEGETCTGLSVHGEDVITDVYQVSFVQGMLKKTGNDNGDNRKCPQMETNVENERNCLQDDSSRPRASSFPRSMTDSLETDSIATDMDLNSSISMNELDDDDGDSLLTEDSDVSDVSSVDVAKYDRDDINENSTCVKVNNLNGESPTVERQKSTEIDPPRRKSSIPTRLPLFKSTPLKKDADPSAAKSGREDEVPEKSAADATKDCNILPATEISQIEDIVLDPLQALDVSTDETKPRNGLQRKLSRSKLPVSNSWISDVSLSEKDGEQTTLLQTGTETTKRSGRKFSTSRPFQSEKELQFAEDTEPADGQHSLEAQVPSAKPKQRSVPERNLDKSLIEEQVTQFKNLKMAMSEVNQDPRTKFLRCLFCAHLFNLNGREPRMLTCCLNAICSACASRLCQESPGMIKCPLCRQTMTSSRANTNDSIDLIDESIVDGGMIDLPIESVRVKTLEFQQIQKGLTFPCSMCSGKTLSTWFCENCDNYMCDTCRDQHKEEVKSKRHSTVAIQTLKSRALKDFKQSHFCKEHNFSKLTLYCSTCSRTICSTCTRDGHERDSHNIQTIQEAFGVKIKQTAKLLSKARKKQKHWTEYSKCMQLKSECSDVSMECARDVINETFDRLMDVMQHRRTELLSELERETSTLATSATVNTDATDCHLSMLNTVTDYTKEYKSKTDNVEFMQLFPLVSDSLKNILDIKQDQQNTSRQGVVFSSWNLRQVESLLRSAGQLKIVTYSPTGRPGREEVSLTPATHPADCNLDTVTTVHEKANEESITKNIVCSSKNRSVLIPTDEGRSAVIECLRLDFDTQTLHADRTVTSDGVMINHAAERHLSNTGCRLRYYPGALADTALTGEGYKFWIVKTKVHIKQRVPDNKMLLETALTGTPVDAPLSQRIDTSLVLAGCDLHHELCIKIKYCCKTIGHFSGCKNLLGTTADFQFGFFLDLNRRRVHIIDINTSTVVAQTQKINIHKPLWPIFCVGRFTYADVKMKLVTSDKITVTPGLFQLLAGIINPEKQEKKKVSEQCDSGT